MGSEMCIRDSDWTSPVSYVPFFETLLNTSSFLYSFPDLSSTGGNQWVVSTELSVPDSAPKHPDRVGLTNIRAKNMVTTRGSTFLWKV